MISSCSHSMSVPCRELRPFWASIQKCAFAQCVALMYFYASRRTGNISSAIESPRGHFSATCCVRPLCVSFSLWLRPRLMEEHGRSRSSRGGTLKNNQPPLMRLCCLNWSPKLEASVLQVPLSFSLSGTTIQVQAAMEIKCFVSSPVQVSARHQVNIRLCAGRLVCRGWKK